MWPVWPSQVGGRRARQAMPPCKQWALHKYAPGRWNWESGDLNSGQGRPLCAHATPSEGNLWPEQISVGGLGAEGQGRVARVSGQRWHKQTS